MAKRVVRSAAVVVMLVISIGCAASRRTQARQSSPTTGESPVVWEKYSDDVFSRARREHKFVLLDLEAVWCHWCHVMDETTYRDAEVRQLIGERYIAVKVDQDSRPDLANRYEDYGWPATVVFNAEGGEIVKRRGYLPPGEMTSMLQAIITDPTPGPSVQPEANIQFASEAVLSPKLREKLNQTISSVYDLKNGSWGDGQKFIDPDTVEYCMTMGAEGDADAQHRARQSLTAAMQLIDPAWGGIYQYSTDGDWAHPHFEKIMYFQAEDMRIYSLAWARYHDAAYLRASQDIHRFLSNFLLSPDGAFYTSQDADLVDGEHSAAYFQLDNAGRRKLGIPRIDTHQYSRENGWAIAGLVALYEASGDASVLEQAKRAANWVIAHRALADGGFSHDEHDAAGPYLGDTLAMGRAFLSLYEATADRQWLPRAQSAADFIAGHFSDKSGAGYITAESQIARPVSDENIMLARFANRLWAYTGNAGDKSIAQAAMRYVATLRIAQRQGWAVGGILLADRELSSEPVHIAIVGAKGDAQARELFVTALRCPTQYKRVEWYDSREGPLANADVQYPKMKVAGAFFCSGGACSSPVSDAQKLANEIEHAN